MVLPIILGLGMAAAGGALTAKGASTKGTKPQHQFYGGSKEAQDAAQRQYQDQIYAARTDMQGGYTGNNVYAGQQGIQTGLGYTRDLAASGAKVQATGAQLLGQSSGRFATGSRTEMEAQRAIQAAVDGSAPSQAELLMRQQASDIAQRQAAMAATARGGNQAAAMRAAMAQGADAQTNAAGQAAALRAQEIATARGQLSQLGQAQYQSGAIPGQLGLGAQAQGIGMQQFGAQAQLQAGQYGASLAAQREAEYLQAQQAAAGMVYQGDIAQEQSRAQAQQAQRDQWFRLGGGLLGAGGAVMGGAK